MLQRFRTAAGSLPWLPADRENPLFASQNDNVIIHPTKPVDQIKSGKLMFSHQDIFPNKMTTLTFEGANTMQMHSAPSLRPRPHFLPGPQGFGTHPFQRIAAPGG